jgi:hypothetical protein
MSPPASTGLPRHESQLLPLVKFPVVARERRLLRSLVKALRVKDYSIE